MKLAGNIAFIPLLLVLASCAREQPPFYELKPVSFEQWEKVAASYAPKILVVDAWATWCQSCLERFPHMVALAEKYQTEGVQFVSLNLDDIHSPDELASAESFVKKVNAQFPHYLMDENMMEAFEKLRFNAIPVVLIYDREGKERYRLTGDNPNQQFSDSDVETAIQALLLLES